MKIKEIRKYQIFSTIFVMLLGTLLHFTYVLSEKNIFIASFSSINESVWEHLKLVYFPMLISIMIGVFYFKKKNIPNFVCSKTIGLLVSIAFTVIFFYSYSGILGRNVPAIDITSFFIAVLLGELVAYILMVNKHHCSNKVAFVVLSMLLMSFILFTYKTPHIGIFKDPVTGNYGKA